MGSIDKVLQIIGVGALLALGIPVGMSVKFDDGQLKADELREVFDVYIWDIEIRATKGFKSAKIELFRSSNPEQENGESLGLVHAEFESSRRSLEAGVYMKQSEAYVLCGDEKKTIALPFSVTADEDPEKPVAYKLGGRGKEIRANTFRLIDYKGTTVLAVMTVE